MGEVLICVRTMTGEVRVRAQEEEVELKTFPTLTNNVTSSFCILIKHPHCSWNGRSQQESVQK
eukprot:4054246-Prorocentrum_lima.AAC.1